MELIGCSGHSKYTNIKYMLNLNIYLNLYEINYLVITSNIIDITFPLKNTKLLT